MVRALFAILLFAGCASPTLVSSKADMGNWNRDDYQCRQESTYGYGGAGIGLVLARVNTERAARRTYTQCMELRGYTVTEK